MEEGIVANNAVQWFLSKGIYCTSWLFERFYTPMDKERELLWKDFIRHGHRFDWNYNDVFWQLYNCDWEYGEMFEYLIKNGHPFPPEGHVLRTLIKDHFGLEP